MKRFSFENYDNVIRDITVEELHEMQHLNEKDAAEGLCITQSSYRGENFYRGINNRFEFNEEILYRDPLTAGMRFQYPHGVILQQSMRRNYYRGENQLYKKSVSSLLRALNHFKTNFEKELYRIVADMRIAEFSYFLNKFEYIKNWNYCDILYDILAHIMVLKQDGLTSQVILMWRYSLQHAIMTIQKKDGYH